MSAYPSLNREGVSSLAAPALQCRRCHQCVICCPRCGVSNFKLIDSASSHKGYKTNVGSAVPASNFTGASGGGGGLTWTCPLPGKECGVTTLGSSPAAPTAFELFCRDAETKCGIAVEMDGNDAMIREEEEEIRRDRRRVHAEAWLAADAETRERYELAASALAADAAARTQIVAGRDAPKNFRRGRGRQASLSSRMAVTPASGCGDGTGAPASVALTYVRSDDGKRARSYKRPTTSFHLFCKHNQQTYQTDGALMKAWRSMSPAEKKPYDDEAAAIRVAPRGKRQTLPSVS
ncbi:hypothetical protein TraAM80_02703 [Trypanosoma rangeli]|uniref:HMG box domain-containing protein n=1 Tax=Trypanosoma rangeli TaxID=5698 RepID=A0A422NSN1_TRYRA|nr:uncharacterized protein TraAM80_02703 [Trypanosoma rangeli]RNF08478.1 hypothetical protein TraAM80_02703 [Trypanosoma rangeli]|eukprot:RNF08478.1 hypothetical protein TraAM80_02703 [Trypanosoma rangeli]